jgi:hypothetical protein
VRHSESPTGVENPCLIAKVLLRKPRGRGEEGGGGERVSVIHNGCSAPVGCSERGLKSNNIFVQKLACFLPVFLEHYTFVRTSDRSPGESSKIAPCLIRSCFIDSEMPKFALNRAFSTLALLRSAPLRSAPIR